MSSPRQAYSLQRPWTGGDGDTAQALRSALVAVYVGAVILTGTLLFVQLAPRTFPQLWLTTALLTAAVALSVFKLRLPIGQGRSTFSMASAVDFTALLLAGPDLAMVVAAVGVTAQCTLRVRERQPVHRTAFSVASVVLAVQASGVAWHGLLGTAEHPVLGVLLPLSAAATTHFAINTLLVATAVGLSKGASALREWHREFFWSAPGYFLSAAVAALVGQAYLSGTYVLLPVAASPLYLSYRAYRMSVARIEEERRHAQELAHMITTTQKALARATESEAALAAEKERLALMSARLSATLQTISEGVVTVNGSGDIVLLNEGAEKLAATTRAEVDHRPVAALLARLGFTDAQCAHAVAQVLAGLPVRLRTETDDGTVRLVDVTGTPTRDVEGHVAGAVWILRDVTDMAHIERERAKSARLESLGVLAGGLAHDFNNILMGVTGNLSLAQTLVDPSEEALLRRLSNAAAACARARGVTNQLLTFAKGGAPVKKTAPIGDLVIECTRFALSGSQVAPSFHLADDLWTAEVDLSQVGQVIQNLALNAMQAMPRGGLLDVRLDNVVLDGDTAARARTDLPPGRYVRLVVQDNGVGIPAELMSRIFDPYFTTKEKGSGLGLAISYSIIQSHGGTITAESEPGRGSRFTVYLPAADGVDVAAPAPRADSSCRSGRVLIMDDEELVAEVSAEMLQSLGYTTQLAANGDEALRMFSAAEQTGAPFDLVLLDLTVPGGMGGAEAVQYIREMRPDARVIVSSGYADDSVLARYREFGFDGVLPKPFTIPELRAAIADVESGGTAAGAEVTPAASVA